MNRECDQWSRRMQCMYRGRYYHDYYRFVYFFFSICTSTTFNSWRSTMALHHHFSSSHVDDDDVDDDDDDDQHHSYILNIYRWHAHISHVFFLLNLSEWVIIVGIRTYVWNFVHGTADFLYAWLHRWSICLSIDLSIFFFIFSKESLRISGYTQREWILCININKNKSRWKSIDTYTHIFSHLRSIRDYIICWRKILLSILPTKEHHFLIMSPVAYFYHKDYREKKVTQSRSLVHIFFKSMIESKRVRAIHRGASGISDKMRYYFEQ